MKSASTAAAVGEDRDAEELPVDVEPALELLVHLRELVEAREHEEAGKGERERHARRATGGGATPRPRRQ